MVSPQDALKDGDALLIVDVQNDFCPGGALPVENGDKVVPIINDWIAAATEKGVPIFASRDWHPKHHLSFESEGGPWPEHCVQDTPGAAFHPDLALPEEAMIVTKGVRFDQDQYSAFDQTGLAKAMRDRGVQRIWIAGLAEDVCVRASALDARKEGFDVELIKTATYPVTPEGGQEALEEMKTAGVEIAA